MIDRQSFRHRIDLHRKFDDFDDQRIGWHVDVEGSHVGFVLLLICELVCSLFFLLCPLLELLCRLKIQLSFHASLFSGCFLCGRFFLFLCGLCGGDGGVISRFLCRIKSRLSLHELLFQRFVCGIGSGLFWLLL